MCDYKKAATNELWGPDISQWAQAMGANAIRVASAAAYAPALEQALDSGAPTVIDVEVSLDIEGYRSIWYPYPANFHDTWKPGPLPGSGARKP